MTFKDLAYFAIGDEVNYLTGSAARGKVRILDALLSGLGGLTGH